MAYTTSAALVLLTGSTLDSSITDAIIAQADRRVNAILSANELTAPASNDDLTAASLEFSMAGLLVRGIQDGSKHSAIQADVLQTKDDLHKLIDTHEAAGIAATNSYIKSVEKTGNTYASMIKKVN